MEKKKVLIRIGSMVVVSMLVLAYSMTTFAVPGEKANKLRIGVILELTGPLAPGMGPEAMQGINTAVDWINGKGGISIAGKKYLIEIVAEDCQSSPEGTIAAANKLIYREKVKYIVGPTVPWLNIAMIPISENAKVLRILNDGTGTPAELNSKMPHTFGSFFIGGFVRPIYDYLVETYPNVKKVAITGVDEPGGHYIMELSKREAEAHGLKVVYYTPYPVGQADFYPVWSKIQEAKPDAVDMGQGLALWQAGIIKAGKDMGFTGPFFTGNMTPPGPNALRDLVGKKYAHDIFSHGLDIENTELSPMVNEIRRCVKEKYGANMVEIHTGAWGALWYLVQAIEAAQNLEPTTIAENWAKMRSIKTIYGPVTMGGLEVYGLNHVVMQPVPLTIMKNGEVRSIRLSTPTYRK